MTLLSLDAHIRASPRHLIGTKAQCVAVAHFCSNKFPAIWSEFLQNFWECVENEKQSYGEPTAGFTASAGERRGAACSHGETTGIMRFHHRSSPLGPTGPNGPGAPGRGRAQRHVQRDTYAPRTLDAPEDPAPPTPTLCPVLRPAPAPVTSRNLYLRQPTSPRPVLGAVFLGNAPSSPLSRGKCHAVYFLLSSSSPLYLLESSQTWPRRGPGKVPT